MFQTSKSDNIKNEGGGNALSPIAHLILTFYFYHFNNMHYAVKLVDICKCL